MRLGGIVARGAMAVPIRDGDPERGPVSTSCGGVAASGASRRGTARSATNVDSQEERQ
jgi:hypothetical protein